MTDLDQTSVLVSSSVGIVFIPRFTTSAWRRRRAGVYIGLCLLPVLVVVHGSIRYGWSAANARVCFDWLLLGLLFDLTGVLIYINRVSVNT